MSSNSTMPEVDSQMEDIVVNRRHVNFTIDFPLCLVHVGKAAGSSVSCGLGLTYADCEGLPRDHLPHVHYFHMRQRHCPSNTQTYVVTLRHPLYRIQSWFDFEKNIIPNRHSSTGGGDGEGNNNKNTMKIPRGKTQAQKQRAMLFQDCYTTFESFVLEGLMTDQQSQPQQPQDGSVNTDFRTTTTTTITISNGSIPPTKIKDMTCPQRAWAAVLGARPFSYHEWYNYEYYWSGIEPTKHGYWDQSHSPGDKMEQGTLSSSTVLYALRTEHLEDDWKTLSTEPLFRPVNRRGQRISLPSSSSVTSLNDTLRTLTSPTFLMENTAARVVLCRALCGEIQYYKKFLSAAYNLSPTQRQESLQELTRECPLETTLEWRDCPTVWEFPQMVVPNRQYRMEVKKRFFRVSTGKIP